MSVTIEELERRLVVVENKLAECEERLRQSEIAREGLKNAVDSIMTTLAEIKNIVNELKSRPANRWEKLIEVLIGAAVGAFITFLTTR